MEQVTLITGVFHLVEDSLKKQKILNAYQENWK